MNYLLIGTNTTERLLELSRPRFLLIDDGEIAEAFLAKFPKARLFDPAEHSFNPLSGITDIRAEELVTSLYAASPGGENTLTVRDGKRALYDLFLSGAGDLSDFPDPSETKDPIQKEALEMVKDIFRSRVLKNVLASKKPNFRIREGTTVAKLDRAVLGEKVALILGLILISRHQGQIILPDAFYLRPLHMSLIHQKRLTCCVANLKELPFALNHFPEPYASGCTYDDAVELAKDARLKPDFTRVDNPYNNFIDRAMG